MKYFQSNKVAKGVGRRAIFFILILVATGIFVYRTYAVTLKAGDFEIKAGESGALVAQHLAERGFIRSALVYRLYLKLCTPSPKFQAGVYQIEWGRNFNELTSELSAIKIQEVTLTIPEGWDLYDIADFLQKNNLVSHQDFFLATGAPAEDYRQKSGRSPEVNWLADFSVLQTKPAFISLEGYLFPDTYRMMKDFTADGLARKMLQNFSRKMASLETDIKASGHSVFEIVTLASIVENEVRTPKNRAMVADIFWRRLKMGMALQSDATVNYITRKGMASPTFDDTKIDSPYNTYKYKGLPLGPIGNPGLAAINAVLRPEPNDYLYFLTTPEGDIYYAKTYEEHLANKRKYL